MATEKTIVEKLEDLYSLQSIDSKLDELEILKGELPMEVSDLEDEITGLNTRVGRLESQIQDMEGDMTQHERNIAEAESLLDRYSAQMDNVKNNREYEALMKEQEMQRLEIQLSNKKIGGIKRDLEAKNETLAATQDRLEKKSAELAEKKVELEKIIEKTEKEEQKLRKASDKARNAIEARLLKSYDRVRGNYRNGLAVVTVERNACGGCFNQIPPQIQLEIAQRKKIIACEHCGRILVDDVTAGLKEVEA
ncbi:MAG: C4-type zinc ribbon domain-containing protein [Bacteroidota bacterium]